MKTCMTSHSQPKIFTEDLLVRDALLRHDGKVTRVFFYQQYYPLFKSIYDNYYTDCACIKEFIDEIYILILAPSKTTGKCQLENFRGESTLTSWLKTTCLYYCYNKYELKERMPKYEPISSFKDDESEESTDRTDAIYGSNDIDFDNLNRQDALAILSLMPNKRYRNIITMRYLEQKTNEETAEALGMTMDNYYNKHKLAKEQYERVWRKEAQHG